ncbi:MAG TPA: hypothetical protein VH459_10545 [Gaiellales bacterium]|jgi:hypothetical protein
MTRPPATATPSAPAGQSQFAARLDAGLVRAASRGPLPTSFPAVGRPDPAYAGAGR